MIPGIGARAGAARWTSDDIADQSGRVVVITGANSGIGLQAATALCAKGAHVIFACRTVAKADAARASLPGSHETRELDLSDLDSVRRFAGEMAGVNLDVLINNAGIMAVPQARSAQGYELQFATNVLGHFLLTGLLLGQIQDRVVTLSSQMHRVGRLDLADLGGEKRPYRAWAAYSQSKLANLMLALELQRRLDAAGSPVISVAAHPGYAATNLQSQRQLKFLLRSLGLDFRVFLDGGHFNFLRLGNRLPFFAQSAEMGALPTLYAATVPDLPGGSYVGPDWPGEMRGHPTLVGTSTAAQDRPQARELWARCEQLCGNVIDVAEIAQTHPA